MTPPNRRLANLSVDDRQVLESWLVEFDQRWEEGVLARRAEQIPPGSSWRLPALAEMVKIDLERQWQRGRQVSLESYLKEFPELGSPGDVSADLIQAEYEVRRQFGAPASVEDYCRRFPHQAAELARLLTETKAPSAVERPREMPRPLPERFGRYRIIKRLGQGAMGSVYLAEDTHLRRCVALKVPDLGTQADPEARTRFLDEARTAATLDHPYLCPVHDAGEIDGRLYLTMAYIEGQSLKETLHGEGLPPRQVAALVGKLALAMQEAHARGVIHRDLKPSNIMIKTTGQRREPVIVDFGLAHRDDPEEVRLTRSGQVMGTLGYMAPEQIRGDLSEVGLACDIYALGVLLYELLTGRLPFSGTGLAVAGQVLTQTPPPPSTHRADLDPRLEAICLKAMAKKIGDRYASMRELAAALTGFLQAPAPTPAATATPQPAHPAPHATASDALVGQLFERIVTDQSPDSAITSPESVTSQVTTPGHYWPPRPTMVAAAVLGLFALGVIVWVATNKGRIKITVDGPAAAVKVDGDVVRVEALGEPITFRAGTHQLNVTWRDGQFKTRTFVIRRGLQEDLRVEYEPIRRTRETASREAGKAPEPGSTQAAGADATGPQKEKPNAIASKPDAGGRTSPGGGPERETTNSIGMRLREIPAGDFLMGSPDSDNDADADEKPQHRVRISRPFYLGVTEVTVGQFRHVVEATGYRTEAEKDGTGAAGWNEEKRDFEQNPRYTWRNPGFAQTDAHPVVNVSWNDAIAFCNKLSELERLTPYYQHDSGTTAGGDCYRLPTEAEWEYACRAGTVTRYYSGNDELTLLTVGNVADGTFRARSQVGFALTQQDGFAYTAPVCQFLPNAFGLHDMHGNVQELCDDGYDDRYYDRSPAVDPRGPSQFRFRVDRGGAWWGAPQANRSARRARLSPNEGRAWIGFRVARGIQPIATASREPEKTPEPAPVPGMATDSTAPQTKATASQELEKAPEPGPTQAAVADATGPQKKKNNATAKKSNSGRRTSRGGRPQEITNSIGMRLRGIPAGEFLMGSPDSDVDAQEDEKPQHRVRISRPFYLGATEVTVGQFRHVVEATGYRTDAEKDGNAFGWNEKRWTEKNGYFEQDPKYNWRNPGFAQTDQHPVVNVSWNDAIAFCNKLSELEKLKPYYQPDPGTPGGGDGYRLPTEAEWEYACRAGTTTRFVSGDNLDTVITVGNVADLSLQARVTRTVARIDAYDGFAYTAPVGQFRPNALGLYDMHGNVWEWCFDGYDAQFYMQSPGIDPVGPSRVPMRVYRGGMWWGIVQGSRSARRNKDRVRNQHTFLGFRVARDIPPDR
jgi:formylglycine-generating enzyme required for sulfatase activity/serine/threonine protein kinase